MPYRENASGRLKHFSEGPSDWRRAVLRISYAMSPFAIIPNRSYWPSYFSNAARPALQGWTADQAMRPQGSHFVKAVRGQPPRLSLTRRLRLRRKGRGGPATERPEPPTSRRPVPQGCRAAQVPLQWPVKTLRLSPPSLLGIGQIIGPGLCARLQHGRPGRAGPGRQAGSAVAAELHAAPFGCGQRSLGASEDHPGFKLGPSTDVCCGRDCMGDGSR